ncbi:Crp/Fnr family transcriptional regulator [Bradyrhizobium pachyrhizi]|uniref:Crp/Fnr family transcriptional regulator n=1 Tax=Bradyrhizobium pachyrhizi TaxID=280333 RepID=UPI003D360217
MLAPSNRRPFVNNTILAGLTLQDLAAIGASLEPTVLKQRMILQEPKKRVEHVYFIESGLVSLRIVAAGSVLENAMVGYRGAIGASFLLGGHIPTHQSVVLLPGSALRIHVDELRRVINERPQIRAVLSQYVQALALHCAQTCLCGIRHNRERRLACWLCLACDTADSHVIPVTHDYLSAMLGLRRAGVTETLIRFEEQGLIRKMRGVLHVDDRKRLEQRACSCYSIVAGAYTSPEQAIQLDRRAEAYF